MIERAVIDVYLGKHGLTEDQIDTARLTRALQFIAGAGPGTDPTVLGQHHGFVLNYLRPRLNTAQQRAQQAGLNPDALQTRFSSPDNLKQIATTFVQQGKDQKASPVKSFSAISAKNLSDHLIKLSGEDQQQDQAQVQQAKQVAVAATQRAAVAKQAALDALHKAMHALRNKS